MLLPRSTWSYSKWLLHYTYPVFLLIVIRIGVKACIDVTLNVELFITSITETHFLIPLRIILTAIWWSTPRSPLYPLARHVVRHTSGAVHSITYYRAYVWSIGDDLRPFSLFCHGRALTLNFIPYNSGKNSFFDWSILNTFKITSRHVLIWKYYYGFDLSL